MLTVRIDFLLTTEDTENTDKKFIKAIISLIIYFLRDLCVLCGIFISNINIKHNFLQNKSFNSIFYKTFIKIY
jgi:hypothetical protein